MPLQELFAVTGTSVYRLSAKGLWVEKIAKRGESKVLVHEKVRGIGKISIGAVLAAPIHSVALVNVPIPKGKAIQQVWRTSPIVALFKTSEEALACAEEKNLVPCDPRFEVQTREVCEEIGTTDPKFHVCKSSRCLCVSYLSMSCLSIFK